MEAKFNYDVQAAYLANAIDIAINAFKSHPPDDWNKAHIDHIIKVYSEWQYDALNPKPEYKKIQSLKYLINDVFTYFHEGEGNTVSYFWEEIKKIQLPYKRVNKMDKIIKAKKIRNQIEYDYII